MVWPMSGSETGILAAILGCEVSQVNAGTKATAPTAAQQRTPGGDALGNADGLLCGKAEPTQKGRTKRCYRVRVA